MERKPGDEDTYEYATAVCDALQRAEEADRHTRLPRAMLHRSPSSRFRRAPDLAGQKVRRLDGIERVTCSSAPALASAADLACRPTYGHRAPGRQS